ncbi:MAG: hypothetical protein HON70_19735, partial [Lentisphaerae bacterium]|nr:hypothetical protein [Lentisphaerota bacterium]
YDGKATKTKIYNQLSRYADSLMPDDSLLIIYCGHGYEDKNTGMGYWIPVDGGTDTADQVRWLSNEAVRGLVKSIPAHQVLVIADACFAGKLFRASPETEERTESFYKKAYEFRTRQVLTSGAIEKVRDDSAFGDALWHTLSTNRSPYLDPYDLFVHARRAVPDRQKPVLGPLDEAGHEVGGSFVFFLRTEKMDWMAEQRKRAEIRQIAAFAAADQDRDGTLSFDEEDDYARIRLEDAMDALESFKAGLDSDGDGTVEASELPSHYALRLKRIREWGDANGNWQISREEERRAYLKAGRQLEASRDVVLALFDDNGDGQLTGPEVTKYAAKADEVAMEPPLPRFGEGTSASRTVSRTGPSVADDANKDGRIDLAEARAYARKRTKGMAEAMHKIVSRYDTDGDGRLAQPEREALDTYWQGKFGRPFPVPPADLDKDLRITKQEMDQYVDSRAKSYVGPTPPPRSRLGSRPPGLYRLSATYDLNGDKQIDKAEAAAYASKMVRAMAERIRSTCQTHDRNGDGRLDEAEKEAMDKSVAESKRGSRITPSRLYSPLDRDGDFRVTQAEFDAYLASRAERYIGPVRDEAAIQASHRERARSLADTDKDGNVSVSEAQAAAEACVESAVRMLQIRYRIYDTDDDGRVSTAESAAYTKASGRPPITIPGDENKDMRLSDSEKQKLIAAYKQGLLSDKAPFPLLPLSRSRRTSGRTRARTGTTPSTKGSTSRPTGRPSRSGILERMDKNGDGKMSADEFPRGKEAFEKLLKYADKDGDGLINLEEMREMRVSRRSGTR